MPAAADELKTGGGVAAMLAPGGEVARKLNGDFEPRPQQVEMAAAVEKAFLTGKHLLAEAGTGVGKSFAYLLPAIDAAVRRKKRVVVSTHTIGLQEQIVDKDVPVLRSLYGDAGFDAVLVKGRGNYLCRRRLDAAMGRQGQLFAGDRERQQLAEIAAWAGRTDHDGSTSSLPVRPDPAVWDRVRAEAGNCMGKRCPHFRSCGWQAAKRRMNAGRLLVVNHALFFSDLALRAAGVTYLPQYDHVVFDEAHTLEDVASQHFGLRVGEGGVEYQLRHLFDAGKTKGFLPSLVNAGAEFRDVNPIMEQVAEARRRAAGFFARCLRWRDERGGTNGRVRAAGFVEDDLSPLLGDIAKQLTALAAGMGEGRDDPAASERKLETQAQAEKLRVFGETVAAVMTQSMPDAVYWVDSAGRDDRRRCTLHAGPVDVAEGLRRELWDKVPGCVLTSATLTASGHGFDKPAPARGGPDRSAPDRGTSDRGTGFQPVLATLEANQVQVRRGANLPHWTADGATYAINFRLADALPDSVLRAWRVERDDLAHRAIRDGRPLTRHELRRLDRLHSTRMEALLDAGRGACWLVRDGAAAKVRDAMMHGDGESHLLLAWCVMPNHVHAVVSLPPGGDLSALLHSWKSFSATAVNRLVGRAGQLWQAESYDHLVRDDVDLEHQVRYVAANPTSAGLQDWPWVGVDEGRVREVLSSGSGRHGLEARATGAAGEAGEADPAFDYPRRRLGLEGADGRQFGSPFDYREQAKLYVEVGLPEPADPAFAAESAERILHWVRYTNGGAFVLFTSYKALIDAANRLKRDFDAIGLPLLVQGQDAPRHVLLERFRSEENAVLFGTSSFWQGVDVRGDRLRNVVIQKLPFAVPDEPVVQARLERVAERGGNGFMDLSVPEAAIKLKQGFGRLIRSRTDRGIVVVLDKRIVTRRYGRAFLDALPDVEVERVDYRR